MISLEKMGSFFVGGRPIKIEGEPNEFVKLSDDAQYDRDPNGTYWIEPAYVQYFKPSKPRQNTPLVLVHGGGSTGAVWEDTPDGRTGWLSRLLEANFPVCVIDNVERGRSGFCAFDGYWDGEAIVRSEEEGWSIFRFGEIEKNGSRSVYEGQQFPVENVSELSKQTVPRWAGNRPLHVSAVNSVADKLGSVVLVGHSQGGEIVLSSTDQRRAEVRACVAIEAHGVPTHFSGDVAGIPLCLVAGDYMDRHELWDRMRKKYDQCLAEWKAHGGAGDIFDLPAMGLKGNSHLPMMDYNSDEVLNLIVDWLDKQRSLGAFD